MSKYKGVSFKEFAQHHHYAVERMLEFLVVCASDALLHLFTIRGEELPTTMRTTFLRAGEVDILPAEVANRLAEAAGMRNLLVHAYSKVDLKIIHESIPKALNDFSEFVNHMSEHIGLS